MRHEREYRDHWKHDIVLTDRCFWADAPIGESNVTESMGLFSVA